MGIRHWHDFDVSAVTASARDIPARGSSGCGCGGSTAAQPKTTPSLGGSVSPSALLPMTGSADRRLRHWHDFAAAAPVVGACCAPKPNAPTLKQRPPWWRE